MQWKEAQNLGHIQYMGRADWLPLTDKKSIIDLVATVASSIFAQDWFETKECLSFTPAMFFGGRVCVHIHIHVVCVRVIRLTLFAFASVMRSSYVKYLCLVDSSQSKKYYNNHTWYRLHSVDDHLNAIIQSNRSPYYILHGSMMF